VERFCLQMSQVQLEPACALENCRLACWVSPDLLLLVGASPATHTKACGDTLLCLRLAWRQHQSEPLALERSATIQHFCEHSLPQAVLAVAGSAQGEAILQMKGGKVVRVVPANIDGPALLGLQGETEQELASFPEDCTTMLLAHQVCSSQQVAHVPAQHMPRLFRRFVLG
jgi:hypothetical protein